MFFFQSIFEVNEMFCLPAWFVLFTNHKQPLKHVWQYLSRLRSNTLYIIWQGVHLLVSYSLEELVHEVMTKWNVSQVFLTHFTLYLYLWWSLCLWWSVSRLIYIFPKVLSLDEKSLGRFILMLFLWNCK